MSCGAAPASQLGPINLPSWGCIIGHLQRE
jgi:hypothetical protein